MIHTTIQPQTRKKRGWTIVLLVLLAFIVGSILALVTTRQTPTTQSKRFASPSPTITSVILPQALQTYYLNSITSNQPVTGYSWVGETLLYSTPNGIFRAGDNVTLVSSSISIISWSENGSALYQTSKGWFWFQGTNGQNTLITTPPLLSPIFSPNGKQYAMISGKTIIVADLVTGTSQTTSADADISYLLWEDKGNGMAVTSTTADTTSVSIFNNKLETLDTIQFSPNVSLVAVSANGQNIAVFDGNKLQILSNQQRLFVDISRQATLTARWISPEILITIETLPPDSLGRKIDNIYYIDSRGNKMLLTTSAPLVRRLDPNQYLFNNPAITALPLVEQGGKLWLLSLEPDRVPGYTVSGLLFLPIPTQQYPDDEL